MGVPLVPGAHYPGHRTLRNLPHLFQNRTRGVPGRRFGLGHISPPARLYCADDPAIRDRYGTERAICIDGREVGWGYEAPKDGLSEAIQKARE
jgi:hypothetical protein